MNCYKRGCRIRGQRWKGKLQETVDRVLSNSRDFDDFLARMRSEGYEVKLGKNISFRAPGQERFTRSKTLGTEYTPEAPRERLGGPRCQFVVVSKAVVGEEIQRLCGFLEVKKFCPLLIANALSGLHFSLNINEQIDLAPVCL